MYHSIYIMFRNKMKQKSIKWCSRGKTVVGEGGDSDWAFYSQARENSWPECWLHSAFSCRFPFWKVKIRAVLVCMIYFTLVKRSLQKISKSLFLCTVLESDLVSFFTSGWPVFPAPLVKEIVFNPLYILASFLKENMDKPLLQTLEIIWWAKSIIPPAI